MVGLIQKNKETGHENDSQQFSASRVRAGRPGILPERHGCQRADLQRKIHAAGRRPLGSRNYTFNLDGARAGDMVRVFQNGKVVAMLLPTSYTPAADGPAVLVIENGKSGSTVREIRLPDSGVALYYGPHRPKHGTAAEEREVAQLIPITTANASR